MYICEECGKTVEIDYGRKRFCGKECMIKHKNKSVWKNRKGKRVIGEPYKLTEDGRLKVKVEGKDLPTYYYIWVWEQVNGPKPKGSVIHHIDGDIENNDISNLQCMTISEHMKLHNAERRKIKPRYCKTCGKQLDEEHYNKKFCSRECIHIARSIGVTKRNETMRNRKEKRYCKKCGKELVYPYYGHAVYCSIECSPIYNTKRGIK